MHPVEAIVSHRTDLKTPVRNRYFYGKLLDAYHFDLETSYLNHKRWLLNRLVSGFGVVCGLDVAPGPGPRQIIVAPGLAIDKHGREIIVPEPTKPATIPAEMLLDHASRSEESSQYFAKQHEDPGRHEQPDRQERFIHVVLCYRECESDPTPISIGGCETKEKCAPGAIRERYSVEFRDGCAPPISTECQMPDVISGGQIDYAMLAKWISQPCPELPEDPCIALADIRIEEGQRCHPEHIDITVRPIVYTNDLLFQLILSLLSEPPRHRGGKA